MIGSDALTIYDSDVPASGARCGGPSNVGVNLGPFARGTVAVCGIVLAIAASCACGVPATDDSTAPASECGGMLRKPAGIASLATNVHGPDIDAAVNQRPASST